MTSRHLMKRGNTYAARYVVPRRFRALVGKATIVKTTGTGDLREAERRAHRILADIHDGVVRQVAKPEANPRDPQALLREAASLHEQVEAGKLDHETAMDILGVQLEAHLKLRGEDAESDIEAPRLATYRSAFSTLSGDVGMLLSIARDKHAAHQTKRGVRGTYVDHCSRMVDLLIEHTGNVAVTRITRKIASSFVLEKVMTLDRSTKTKREYVTALSVLFNWLSTTGVVDVNAFHGLGKLVETNKRGGNGDKAKPRPWTDPELAKLQKLPEDDPLRGVGLLSLWCGLRTDEAASLKVADVDLKAKTVRVTAGKNASAVRIVPIHSAIVPAVKKLVAAADKAKREHLFDLKPSPRDGKRAPSLRAYRRMTDLFGEHDKRTFVFYGLKHTFITALERAGIDRTLRERICGHTPKDINSAVYSAGAGIEQMRKAVQKVSFKTFRG